MREIVRHAIVNRVRAVFNDRVHGERPVERHEDGLFGRQSPVWRVHGDVTTMMVGGVAALLLQMLHPAVLAGVWDHSNFRNDMLGRLRRTARFIALTTYGSRPQAEDAIQRVRAVHAHVRGVLPDGIPYAADDPDLLRWVHATETFSFLESWMRYSEPRMPVREQDRYFAEVAIVAEGLGATGLPATRVGMISYIEAMRPSLRADARTREVARILLNQRPDTLAALPVQRLTFQAAVDLLPGWARQMHGLKASAATRPIVQGGTLGLARTLRWAFQQPA